MQSVLGSALSSSRRPRAWLCLGLLSVLACNSAHTQGSTETGNPPVIDVDRISLVVSNDGIEIVGETGAVTPGGATVEIAVVGTDDVVRGDSKADGSFAIALDTSPDAVVEVSAGQGEQRSATIYVTRGGAMVGNGQGAMLSCMQRSNLASQVVGGAITRAQTPCQSAADCQFVSNKTSCTDSCGDSLVTSADVASIESAVSAVDEGLCASFSADGCNFIALPCEPPITGPIACVAGMCTVQPQTAVDCPSCLNREVSWGPSSGLRTYKISGCDSYSLSSMGAAACSGTIPHCGASATTVTLEDLLRALMDPDVTQALADQSTLGGAPSPGGMNLKISVDGATFLVSVCSGASCPEVPQGVRELRQILDNIANEVVCN